MTSISKKYPVKVQCIMVPGPKDAREVTILNRTVRWEDDEVSLEADPKHVEKMLEDVKLAERKPNLVPGSREGGHEEGTALERERARMYRSVVARPTTSRRIDRISSTPPRSSADKWLIRPRATGIT